MNVQNNIDSLSSLKKNKFSIQQVVDFCSGFIQISQPDVIYQSSTTKIDISSIPEFSIVNSINDGVQTVTFSTPMEKNQVGSSWITWSSPPFSENVTPPILYTQGATTLTIDLLVPSRIFGFELEPNPFDSFEFTVLFLSSGILLGSITQTVAGNAGARLFAAALNGTCPPVDQVVITGPVDFAIAQVRYMFKLECACQSSFILPQSTSIVRNGNENGEGSLNRKGSSEGRVRICRNCNIDNQELFEFSFSNLQANLGNVLFVANKYISDFCCVNEEGKNTVTYTGVGQRTDFSGTTTVNFSLTLIHHDKFILDLEGETFVASNLGGNVSVINCNNVLPDCID